MDSLPLSLDDLRRLIALFDLHRLTDLEIREGGVRVRLGVAARRPRFDDPESESADERDEAPLSTPGAAEREPTPSEKGWVAIAAPMAGAFYRAPGPNEPTFVEVGSPIEVDQVIGLIEAMKIFSEIRSEVAGTVLELPAASGQIVQPGQVLAWVLPDRSEASG